jgi:ABC-type transport system substrate-binding protein
MGTEFMQIDTRASLFHDARVRQALSYAVDRDRVVQLYGGPLLATPTCQVVPPGLSGYRRYCPYTARPSRAGNWTGPDLSRARRLVAASGTSGAHVTVWAESAGFHNSLPRYVAGVLRTLGYKAEVREGTSSSAPAMAQIRPVTWFGGELGPAQFLQDWFACDGGQGNGWFCDPRLDRLMSRASSVEATDARRAAAEWADVDRKAVDTAASVPLVTPREVEFVSSRVRNYQFNPIWGLLADQVWLR